MRTVLLFVYLWTKFFFCRKKTQLKKSFHHFTYQLDHDELVDPSDKMHLSHGVLVGVVELNVDVVAVDKAVDNGTVVHNRVAVASLVSQTMTTGRPFVRHAFVLIKRYNEWKRWRRQKRCELRKTKLTKHKRGFMKCAWWKIPTTFVTWRKHTWKRTQWCVRFGWFLRCWSNEALLGDAGLNPILHLTVGLLAWAKRWIDINTGDCNISVLYNYNIRWNGFRLQFTHESNSERKKKRAKNKNYQLIKIIDVNFTSGKRSAKTD